jgi:hypothetical protein
LNKSTSYRNVPSVLFYDAVNNSIKFLFIYVQKLNSPKANYKVSISKEKKPKHTKTEYKDKAIYIILEYLTSSVRMANEL